MTWPRRDYNSTFTFRGAAARRRRLACGASGDGGGTGECQDYRACDAATASSTLSSERTVVSAPGTPVPWS
jgi:hypothetical protein